MQHVLLTHVTVVAIALHAMLGCCVHHLRQFEARIHDLGSLVSTLGGWCHHKHSHNDSCDVRVEAEKAGDIEAGHSHPCDYLAKQILWGWMRDQLLRATILRGATAAKIIVNRVRTAPATSWRLNETMTCQGCGCARPICSGSRMLALGFVPITAPRLACLWRIRPISFQTRRRFGPDSRSGGYRVALPMANVPTLA